MPSYKFQIGQRSALTIPRGIYIITKKLPERNDERDYCVKSADEPYERVVGESELRDAP